ncbi:unnamed protein product [Timema podura]|uniref:Uncharacterized protein n=1 Tax=Timema podura TaxID=61482 RepID=A0ABN7PAH3_TIMPD|nr:unnamed protein product [Timema podura]
MQSAVQHLRQIKNGSFYEYHLVNNGDECVHSEIVSPRKNDLTIAGLVRLKFSDSLPSLILLNFDYCQDIDVLHIFVQLVQSEGQLPKTVQFSPFLSLSRALSLSLSVFPTTNYLICNSSGPAP